MIFKTNGHANCPPDYNSGFCADYGLDCDACWAQWVQEQDSKRNVARLLKIGMDMAWCEWGNCSVCGGKNPMTADYCNWCGARLRKE